MLLNVEVIIRLIKTKHYDGSLYIILGETAMCDAIAFMKKEITNTYDVQDQRKLTAKSWRKAWAEEGAADPEMADLARRIMCHGKETRDKHYLAVPRQGLAKLGRRVVGKMLNASNADDSEVEEEEEESSLDSEEESEREEEVVVPRKTTLNFKDKKVIVKAVENCQGDLPTLMGNK